LNSVWNFVDINAISYWNRACADILEEQGAKTYLFCQEGGEHCEADWEKQIPTFMDFLWK